MDQKKDGLAYEYTQETSLHGIGRAVNKEKSLAKRTNTKFYSRVCWTTFFLACFGLFLYFLCDALIRYFDYPTSTKLTYNTESKLEFPSVTICNFNRLTASYLARKNDPLLNATVEYLDNFAPPPSDELQEYMKTVDMAELYINGSHQFEYTYMTCQFAGVDMTDPSSGTGCRFPEGLIVPRKTQMGVCHTFQPQSYIEEHGTLKSVRAGSAGGLQLVMNIAQDDYKLAGFSAGMKVLVHDPKVTPRVLELGSGLEPGTDVYMSILKNEMVDLPHPYAKKEDSCVDTEASDYVNPLKYSEYYSDSACFNEGLIEAMLKYCGCVDYLLGAPGQRVCSVYEFDTCILPIQLQYYTNETTPYCPKPCHYIQYDVSLSQSYFPSEYKVDSMARLLGIPQDYFADYIISLNVYFGELEFTKIEQEAAYTFVTAIAGIGGYMGLCLGASILTVFELFELFWDYCAYCDNKSEKRNKVDENKLADKKADDNKPCERKPDDYPQFADYAM